VFWINLPIGLAAFLLCRRALAGLATPRSHWRIDYLGGALLTAAVADLLLIATWDGVTYAWTSPTLLTPLMGGSVVGAFSAGQMMRYTGRYKIFPLIGLSLSVIAFALLATMTAATAPATAMIHMGLLGVGIGMSMPVMLVAVQNAADARDIGAATATVGFFRSLGGSFGAAILWSIFLLALDRALAESGAGGAGIALLQGGPDAAAQLPPAARALLMPALERAFHLVFAIGAVIAGLSVVASVFLKELPLRTRAARAAVEE
jgi:hypothetical protein